MVSIYLGARRAVATIPSRALRLVRDLAPSVSSNPEDCANDATAWAVGAMDVAESNRFKAHVETCMTCQTEARHNAETIEAIALTVPQLDPPKRLGRAIATHARVALALETGSHRVIAHTTPRRLPRWVTPGRVAAVVTASSLVLCVASGTYATAMHAHSTRHALVASRLAQTLSVIYHPGATMRTLVGTDRAPGSSARLSMVPSRNAAVLVAYDLPPLAREFAYQLWATIGGTPASAGTFEVDDQGQGVLMIDLRERLLDRALAVAVTREPADGSPNPTGPELLTGRL
jgi:hypothetical protein